MTPEILSALNALLWVLVFAGIVSVVMLFIYYWDRFWPERHTRKMIPHLMRGQSADELARRFTWKELDAVAGRIHHAMSYGEKVPRVVREALTLRAAMDALEKAGE